MVAGGHLIVEEDIAIRGIEGELPVSRVLADYGWGIAFFFRGEFTQACAVTIDTVGGVVLDQRFVVALPLKEDLLAVAGPADSARGIAIEAWPTHDVVDGEGEFGRSVLLCAEPRLR
jgi:hypothetical protein